MGALQPATDGHARRAHPDRRTLASALARAHARSGEPAAISGYLGKSDVFDRAVTAFAVAYAGQCERDDEHTRKAARAGRLQVHVEA